MTVKRQAIISIKEIAIDCILGVSDRERSRKQKILVSLDLVFDASKAGRSDNIADTVNYRIVYERIIKTAERSRFHLLEAFASAILAVCFEDKRVLKATVRVTKPDILAKAKGVTVEMSKERLGYRV